jgi:hypothetical protein
LSGDFIEVTIGYRNKEGELLFPHVYGMDTRKAKTYPTQKLKSGIILYLIPIDEFKIVAEGVSKGKAKV